MQYIISEQNAKLFMTETFESIRCISDMCYTTFNQTGQFYP